MLRSCQRTERISNLYKKNKNYYLTNIDMGIGKLYFYLIIDDKGNTIGINFKSLNEEYELNSHG